jgi:hypothetical protein
MLIVNDTHRLLAGVVSLNEPCPYCCQPLRSYPLIMSDDAAQTVYHAACAVHMSGSLCSPHPMQLLKSRPLRRAGERGGSRTKGVADALK